MTKIDEGYWQRVAQDLQQQNIHQMIPKLKRVARDAMERCIAIISEDGEWDTDDCKAIRAEMEKLK